MDLNINYKKGSNFMIYTEKSYMHQMSRFMSKVYGLMSGALLLSGAVAYYCSQSLEFISYMKSSPLALLFLFVAQIGLVIAIAGFLNRISAAVALGLFILYAVLTGVTLSSIFLLYTASSIFSTFIVTAAMFSSMAIYGYFTMADLSGMGSLLLMGLIGMILTSIVNMFMQSPTLSYFISGAGVILFTLLIAYDVQKLKMFGQYAMQDEQAGKKFVIFGALTLYLDFINLFLNLLQFMGRKKD